MSQLQQADATKDDRLYIRLSPRQKQLLNQAARARHLSTSQFVMQASMDAAQEILADQTEFRLSPEQWEAFCERLDEPAKEIPALRQLFRESDPF